MGLFQVIKFLHVTPNAKITEGAPSIFLFLQKFFFSKKNHFDTWMGTVDRRKYRTKPLPSRLGLQNTPTVSQKRGKTHSGCRGYDTKQFDGEVPVMLEFGAIQMTPSLSSLPGPHWPEMEAPVSIFSMGKIGLNYVLVLNWIA